MLYALINPITGIVTQAGVGPSLPDGAVQIGKPISIDALLKMWWDGTSLVARPTVATPSIADDVITVGPVPEGTTVELLDMSGEEQMTMIVADAQDWVETIQLPDAGIYQIEVVPPLPYLPVSQRVIIA